MIAVATTNPTHASSHAMGPRQGFLQMFFEFASIDDLAD